MRRLLVANALLLILVASSWPLFHSGFFRVHDYTHGARIAEMTRAVTDGHIPPQWSQNFGYGYGMPLYLFYAPLPYYFGAFVFWLFGSILFSVSSVFFLANLLTIVAAYYLGKRLFGSIGALLLSALITLAPYRAVNVFIRGAISEAWGIAASVWMLLGLVLVLQKHRHGWVVLALSTAGLLLSHNLITMIFLPFFTLFALVFIVYKKAWKQAITTLGSTLLGVGMAAYYILPAFLEKSLTQVEGRILTHYFDFHLHFLYLRQLITPYWGYGGSVWGPVDEISFFLGYGMLTGFVLVAAAVFQTIRKKKNVRSYQLMLAVFSFLLGCVALLMTTEKTLFIWDQVEVLRFVQFPWRFLSVAIIFLSLAITSGVMTLRGRVLKIVITGFLVILLLSNARYFRPESYLADPEQLYSADESQIAESMSGILPDFMPESFDETAVPVNFSKVVIDPTLPQESELVNRVHEKLVFATFTDETELTFAIADFPGWQVEIDGKRVGHQKSAEGLLQVTVPTGSHLVGVLFLPTPIRTWANGISVVSILVLFGIMLHRERQE
ncbi:MAG: 6-pyruvoyl-tetrahydropterin synthase-related protein [bacterium]|nr:6-pyruvoyl-tetrahydropterin synthase-related protein [bacterium]